jgi:hypothetical protein
LSAGRFAWISRRAPATSEWLASATASALVLVNPIRRATPRDGISRQVAPEVVYPADLGGPLKQLRAFRKVRLLSKSV